MRNLKQRLRSSIFFSAIGLCLCGIASPAHGQQGSLHGATLHPSQFVYGSALYARPIPLPSPNGLLNGYSGAVPLLNGTGVAPSNVFGSSYANPLAAGREKTFGAPLYGSTPTTNVVTPSAPAQSAAQVSAVPLGQPGSELLTTAPDSATVVTGPVGNNAPVRATPRIQVPASASLPSGMVLPRNDLQQVISRSSALSPRDSIRVVGKGLEVILRGSVTSDYDRRMAEALLMLSPGVQTVRNELTVEP
jgi:hypothetical protein